MKDPASGSVAIAVLLLSVSACSVDQPAPTTTTRSPPVTSTPEATTSTTSTTVVPTTTAPPAGLALLKAISAGLDHTLSGSFSYRFEFERRATAHSANAVDGIRDAEGGHILEVWGGGSLAGTYVGDGYQALGVPNQLEWSGFKSDVEWAWLEIPVELDGVFFVDHPGPLDNPVFRFDAALREVVDSTESAIATRTASFPTLDGLVLVDQYELTVPASVLAEFLGDGSVSGWLERQAPLPDIEVTVIFGLDGEGRFRQFSLDSRALGDHVHEYLDTRAPNGYIPSAEFEIEILSLDTGAGYANNLTLPTDPEAIDADEYLTAYDRPPPGSCVTHYEDLSLPVLAGPYECIYAQSSMSLGPINADSLGESYPGYNDLYSFARQGCEQHAEDLVGADWLQDNSMSVGFSVPGPVAWELGDRHIMCGVNGPW
ncbi:MAG: hypothetical protein GY720_05470 [bacterium]|nr:hypothetical protein [bacterium]